VIYLLERRDKMLKVLDILKDRKSLLVLILLLVVGINTSYASEYIPKDRFQKTVYDFEPTWAVYKLGEYYEQGYGTSVDISKAYVFYKLGAQVNSEHSIKALALLKVRMTQDQIAKAEVLFKQIDNQLIMKAINDAHPRVE
jgi:hypothetical protein